MTERESEELYEELRRKLEGYGSTPPLDLWAAIQQQLPPNGPEPPARPVPRPALRQRWVWSLLFIGVAVVSVLGIRLASRPETAALPTAAVPTAKLSRPAGAAPTAQPAPRIRPANRPLASAPGAAASAETGATGSSKATTTSATNAAQRASRETNGAMGITTTDNAASQPRTPLPHPQTPILAGTMPAATPQRGQRGQGRSVGSQPLDYTLQSPLAARRKDKAKAHLMVRSSGHTPPAIIADTPARSQAAAILPDSGASLAAAGQLESAAAVRERQQVQNAADTTQEQTAFHVSRRLKAGVSTASNSPTRSNAEPLKSGSSLQPSAVPLASAAPVGSLLTQLPRASQLQQLAVAWPAVQPVDVAPQVLRPASRWAVELLAGPAISHRRLGQSDSASLSQLERPALTFATQLQVRYFLTPRLSVSGGLGYTTYATRLNLLLQPPRDTAGGVLPTPQAVQQRDAYRFFTLPLQAQYQLGGQTRLRYGVAAGAAVELYAGGRTSGNTPCTCSQQQTWSATNSPYRRLGVSLTAGLDVRYALTPRLHLLVQPTGRYALFSIVAPGTTAPTPSPIPPPGGNPLPSTTTLPARHPFAAGLLTGFSFDLR